MKKKISIVLLTCVLILSVLFVGCGDVSLNAEKPLKFKVDADAGFVRVTAFPESTATKVVTIPDEYEGLPVTVIDDFASANLENLETVNIGKNVQEIGSWAFENNQKLKEFKVDPENPYFCDVDGVLYTKDMKTLLYYPNARGVETVTETDANGNKNEVKRIVYEIPDGVEVIRSKAFYKCGNLTALTLPNSLITIEEKAFFRCGSLKDVKLPAGVTVIAKDAFGYCTALQEIVIPASITELGEYAFYNCTSLKNVEVLRAEAEVQAGQKWYPTDNGRKLDGLTVTWTVSNAE